MFTAIQHWLTAFKITMSVQLNPEHYSVLKKLHLMELSEIQKFILAGEEPPFSAGASPSSMLTRKN